MDLGFICAIDIQPLLDFDRKNKFFTFIYEENKINKEGGRRIYELL
jgi:hypothetical protein